MFMAAKQADPVMERVQQLFQLSEMTLDALGERMGYPPESARKSAWQFLRQTNDPRISMLRKFATAMGVSLAELVEEKKKGR
jgi:transcriptional regulator with XRE-family HTH domain